MDAVLREELASLVAGYEVIVVFFTMSLLVRLLNATAAGSIVSSHGKTDNTAVAELHRLLHKAFAKGAPADNGASVVILDRPCKDFTCTCAYLIYKHHDRQLLESAATIAVEFLSRAFAAFRIDYQLAGRQELIHHLNSDVHVAAPVAAKVNDEPAHAFHVEVCKCDKHLGIRLLTEVLDMNKAGFVIYHVIGINTDYGNVAANHGEVLQVLCPVTLDAEFNLRSLLALEPLHYIIALHPDKRLSVCSNDAVTSQDAHFLCRTAVDDGHDVDGILFHRELYSNAAEGAFQVFACLFSIFRTEVTAVRVELTEYLRHGILDQRIHVYGINIVVVDELQQVAHFRRACVDDVDATSGEMACVEGADEDACYCAEGNEQWRKAMLVFWIHGVMSLIFYWYELHFDACSAK